MPLTRLELDYFTAFTNLKLDLSPGINVLVGGNGTGKTHLMKVCYAACEASRSRRDDFFQKLVAVILKELFLPSRRSLGRLVGSGRVPNLRSDDTSTEIPSSTNGRPVARTNLSTRRGAECGDLNLMNRSAAGPGGCRWGLLCGRAT